MLFLGLAVAACDASPEQAFQQSNQMLAAASVGLFLIFHKLLLPRDYPLAFARSPFAAC